MSSFQDPKTLAEWLELDYYRRPRRFGRLHALVAWATLLVCLGLVAWTLWPKARTVYEAHPVSSAHAMFNDRCELCHDQAFGPARRFLTGAATAHSVSDATCGKCHEGALHQAPEAVAHPTGCAGCHPEHRGRTVLARVPDGNCTACHAQLTRADGQPSPFHATITGFATDHPDFDQRPGGLVDTGTVRFNHAAHLRLPDLARKVRLHGIDAPVGALARKECQLCHKTDDTGQYMKPINYDEHCRQCHPLTVQLVGDWQGEHVQAEAVKFNRAPVPHKDPRIIREELEERYREFFQANRPMPAEPPATDLPQVLPIPAAPPAPQGEADWVQAQLDEGQRMLFASAGGCRFCHTQRVAYDRETRRLPKYALSAIPARWLKHSRFSHRSHRLLLCTECHDSLTSTKTSDVRLPRIADCRACHRSGARTDCAECHHYHNRDRWEFAGQATIPEFGRNQ